MISDEGNVTLCPLTLKESEMTPGNCTPVEVHAEQYGVVSDKKIYVVCYYGKLWSKVKHLIARITNNIFSI